MVKILSFDVGIKNLAYCIVEFKDNSHTILDWGILDIMELFLKKNIKCSVVRNGKACTSDAIVSVKTDTDHRIGFCKKITCQKNANATYSSKQLKKVSIINTKSVNILDLSSELIRKLRTKPNFLDVDIVVIENQPVLKNPTMKTIQMIVYTFFLIYGVTIEESPVTSIALFNASRKLDIYDGPALETDYDPKTYSGRKHLSIEYTRIFLLNNPTQLEFFNNNNKKDDLADSYLQCLTYYKKNQCVII
jgi:hypothetical protein